MTSEEAAAPPWRVYTWGEIDEPDRTRILRRSLDKSFDPGLLDEVRELIDDVRAHGDAAVSRALERFDRCTVEPDRLRVEPEEIEAAAHGLGEDLRSAIRYGI